MAEKETTQPKRAGLIKDARGRKVKQLDPVAMRLLHQHSTIEADTLRAIASEKGVAISAWERVLLVYSVIAFVATVIGTVYYFFGGSSGDTALRRMARLTWYSFWPVFFWWKIKQGRFVKTAAVMLEHLRCPHCGYDLRLLPVDTQDGATVCPECGCAWMLDDNRDGGGHVDG